MRVEVKTPEEEVENTYPRIMQWVGEDDLVVLFTTEYDGIRLRDAAGSPPLAFTNQPWVSANDPEKWKLFNGSITISNN